MTDINNLFDALKSELKKEETVKTHFDTCSYCNGNLMNIKGEMICKECGIINYGVIDLKCRMEILWI